MSRRYSHNKDRNHAAVVGWLKARGWTVLDTSQTGLGFDLLCGRNGTLLPIEVKDRASSRGLALSPREEQARTRLAACGVVMHIVADEADVAALEG